MLGTEDSKKFVSERVGIKYIFESRQSIANKKVDIFRKNEHTPLIFWKTYLTADWLC